MVKELLLLFIAGSAACSTLHKSLPETHELPFEGASSPKLKARKLWSQELPGKLTDLSVASGTDQILVTQVLDGQGPGNTRLSLRSSDGNVLWTLSLDSPVRSQTFSQSGEWILIGTYDDELIRIDPKTGKKIWTVEDSGMCRPHILEKSKQILCYHDDDSLPGVAFTIFDSKGQIKTRFKVPQDILVLKVSPDESQIALGLVRGKVWFINSQFKKALERDVGGEIVDFGISSRTDPALASEQTVHWSALVNIHNVGQKLVGMSASGKSRWELLLDSPHQQIELSDDGSSTAIYGNGPKGQWVSLWGPGNLGRFSPIWSYRSNRYADYNQRIDLTGEDTVLGFEEVTERTRHSHVVALQKSGKLDWDIPLMSEDGAYLYARGLSSRTGLVVVGTDDGVLSAYATRP
jgi:outer membrane protein assembly factor BamB